MGQFIGRAPIDGPREGLASMRDPELNQLVSALDNACEWATSHGVSVDHELAVAKARLDCLSRKLGDRVRESPYLAFLRRTCGVTRGEEAVAASA